MTNKLEIPDRQQQRRETVLPEWVKMACVLKWEKPFVSWDEIAKKCGHDRVQLWRWRKTEAFEIEMRERGIEHAAELAPAAMRALLKAWKDGNPVGAIDVLRSFAFLLNERTEVHVSGDLKAELDRLEQELGIPATA